MRKKYSGWKRRTRASSPLLRAGWRARRCAASTSRRNLTVPLGSCLSSSSRHCLSRPRDDVVEAAAPSSSASVAAACRRSSAAARAAAAACCSRCCSIAAAEPGAGSLRAAAAAARAARRHSAALRLKPAVQKASY
jgi:hypothetical protein